jgi:hypothetical protein
MHAKKGLWVRGSWFRKIKIIGQREVEPAINSKLRGLDIYGIHAIKAIA